MIHFENEFLRVSILPKGATIYSLQAKVNGRWNELLLQYEDMELYQENPKYLNCFCGYHAGRVKDAKYNDAGKTMLMDANSGMNHLHGGRKGLHTYDYISTLIDHGVKLTHDDSQSHIELTYWLEEEQLKIHYHIQTKENMLINPTQHFYFKLDHEKTIEDYIMQIPAERVMSVDEGGVADGTWIAVEKTAFDFRKPTIIKERMHLEHPQFESTGFIDHAYETLQRPVTIASTKTKIQLSLWSDASMDVVYTCNAIDPKLKFKHVGGDREQIAIAIEPQDCPNGVNLKTIPNQIYGVDRPFERNISLSVKTFE